MQFQFSVCMYGTCGGIDNKADFDLTLTFVSNSDPCQIITPLVLVGLGLGNHIARGGNNLSGVENGHNTGLPVSDYNFIYFYFYPIY